MPTQQEGRHRRFEEKFPLLGTLNGEPIENKIKSFLDEEVALAIAQKEKEIVEMIVKEVDMTDQQLQDILSIITKPNDK